MEPLTLALRTGKNSADSNAWECPYTNTTGTKSGENAMADSDFLELSLDNRLTTVTGKNKDSNVSCEEPCQLNMDRWKERNKSTTISALNVKTKNAT